MQRYQGRDENVSGSEERFAYSLLIIHCLPKNVHIFWPKSFPNQELARGRIGNYLSKI